MRTSHRAFAALIALACLGVLIFAATLRPAESGMGTHQQLGLPPCHWLVMYDTPCPTCGMTTAFSRAAHGSILGSIRAQPAGAAFVIGIAVLFWIAAHAAITGSAVLRAMWRMSQRWVGPVVGALLIAGWAYTLLDHHG